LGFSDINSKNCNNINEDIFGNRIIILKRVKSLKQLRRTEKELVRLNYKEAIIKGFTLKGIQQYIASKTKIWIEWSCLECLKKAEEQENREWYYHMARDHFAYVGAYRKCIDEIEQLKKEMWSIIMDFNTTKETKILASKELHSLCKTYTLLIRDLPFVTNLSKFYDQDVLNSSYVNSLHLKETHSNRDNPEVVREPTQGKDFSKPENPDKPIDFKDINGKKTSADENGLGSYKTPNKYKSLDDKVFEGMQGQLHFSDSLKDKDMDAITDEDLNKTISPEHKESVRKLREILDI
jgi:hypothetical protein